MAERAKDNLPEGSLKYLFVYLKVRIFKSSYRIYIYIFIFIDVKVPENHSKKLMLPQKLGHGQLRHVTTGEAMWWSPIALTL